MKNKVTFKRIAAFTAALVMSITCLTSTGFNDNNIQTVANAESKSLKNNSAKISKAEKELSELQKEQAELDKKIQNTDGDIKSEKENQEAINKQITVVQNIMLRLSNSIEETQEKINALETSIEKKQGQVDEKKTQITKGIENFKERVRLMYINGADSYADILIGSTDFYDMLMKIELVKKVAAHDDNMIDNLVTLKGQYESEQAQLEKSKKELEQTKKTLENRKTQQSKQKKKLEELFKKSKAMQQQLEKDKKAFESNKAQAKKESQDFEAKIQKLYKQRQAIKKKEAEAARRRAAAAAAAAARRRRQQAASSSSSGTHGGGSNSSYGYTDKSQFTWPVPGFYHISYGVGWRWGAYHAGIDIYSPNIRGAAICAAASGTVIYVNTYCPHDYGKNGSCGCGGGYGKHVIIDHGNGYWTLYGHQQNVAVRQGQYVKKGQVIGYVGSTGYSTGPHLHFEIRLNGVAQDPQKYV